MGIAVLVIGGVDAASQDPALGVRSTVALDFEARAYGVPEYGPWMEAQSWTTLRKMV
jgi:hypothetical protein